MTAFLAIAALLVSSALSKNGVDVSQYTDVFSCIKSHDYSFAVVRGYCSYGGVDPNVVSNIKNARSAGLSVGVYLFPCVPCGNPGGQADALVDAIKGQSYDRIWVDIERYRWSSSKSANQEFISTMISRLQSRGQRVGVYSNYYNWEEIVGLDWTGASSHPLWYAHYDGTPNFNDYQRFGGWSSPSIKQYKGDTTLCGAGVDLNWSP